MTIALLAVVLPSGNTACGSSIAAAFGRARKSREQTQENEEKNNTTTNSLYYEILIPRPDIDNALTKSHAYTMHNVLSILGCNKICSWMVRHVLENGTNLLPSNTVQQFPKCLDPPKRQPSYEPEAFGSPGTSSISNINEDGSLNKVQLLRIARANQNGPHPLRFIACSGHRRKSKALVKAQKLEFQSKFDGLHHLGVKFNITNITTLRLLARDIWKQSNNVAYSEIRWMKLEIDFRQNHAFLDFRF